jgi:hypothetical protein
MHLTEPYKSLTTHSKALGCTQTEPTIDPGAAVLLMPKGRGITCQYALFLEFDGDWDDGGNHWRVKALEGVGVGEGLDCGGQGDRGC